jgi:peptide-methionine (R)-S-oxide reductase
MKIASIITASFVLVIAAACGVRGSAGSASLDTARAAMAATGADSVPVRKITKSDEEWRRTLTEAQYDVLRKKGTEAAFTGAYWDNHEKGVYSCAACGLDLFASDTKFESGTGWPSFWAPIAKTHVELDGDSSFGMARTEVVCARCGGHLGHVFDDGPKPTGLRYCINSVSLSFKKAES